MYRCRTDFLMDDLKWNLKRLAGAAEALMEFFQLSAQKKQQKERILLTSNTSWTRGSFEAVLEECK